MTRKQDSSLIRGMGTYSWKERLEGGDRSSQLKGEVEVVVRERRPLSDRSKSIAPNPRPHLSRPRSRALSRGTCLGAKRCDAPILDWLQVCGLDSVRRRDWRPNEGYTAHAGIGPSAACLNAAPETVFSPLSMFSWPPRRKCFFVSTFEGKPRRKQGCNSSRYRLVGPCWGRLGSRLPRIHRDQVPHKPSRSAEAADGFGDAHSMTNSAVWQQWEVCWLIGERT